MLLKATAGVGVAEAVAVLGGLVVDFSAAAAAPLVLLVGIVLG